MNEFDQFLSDAVSDRRRQKGGPDYEAFHRLSLLLEQSDAADALTLGQLQGRFEKRRISVDGTQVCAFVEHCVSLTQDEVQETIDKIDKRVVRVNGPEVCCFWVERGEYHVATAIDEYDDQDERLLYEVETAPDEAGALRLIARNVAAGLEHDREDSEAFRRLSLLLEQSDAADALTLRRGEHSIATTISVDGVAVCQFWVGSGRYQVHEFDEAGHLRPEIQNAYDEAGALRLIAAAMRRQGRSHG